jgi:hypothetical protein
MDLVTQVIERKHAIEKHQHAVGLIQVSLGTGWELLKLPHYVVRHVTHGAPSERWKALDDRGRVLME